MKNKVSIRAFTLFELLMVLIVIGIIAAILIPMAIQIKPNEDVLRFKKGNHILGTVIRELVTSDKYYKDGDLSIRADGSEVDNQDFCKSFADNVNVLSENCDTVTSGANPEGVMAGFDVEVIENSILGGLIDEACRCTTDKSGVGFIYDIDMDDIGNCEIKPFMAGIQTTDHIEFKDINPGMHFARKIDIDEPYFKYTDDKGFYTRYKVICMDIGNDVAPFGYGIRVDGKILYGARAQEWIKKSIHDDEENTNQNGTSTKLPLPMTP